MLWIGGGCTATTSSCRWHPLQPPYRLDSPEDTCVSLADGTTFHAVMLRIGPPLVVARATDSDDDSPRQHF